jgi:general secretion pathway protein I
MRWPIGSDCPPLTGQARANPGVGLAALSPRRRGSGGFTLVEALAAVAIIGIVMPVALYGISLATQAAGLAQQRSEASEIAANKLNEIIVTNQWSTGGLAGDVEQGPRTYHWESTVQGWTVATLHEVGVTVTWNSHGRPRTLIVTTLMYDGGSQP